MQTNVLMFDKLSCVRNVDLTHENVQLHLIIYCIYIGSDMIPSYPNMVFNKVIIYIGGDVINVQIYLTHFIAYHSN